MLHAGSLIFYHPLNVSPWSGDAPLTTGKVGAAMTGSGDLLFGSQATTGAASEYLRLQLLVPLTNTSFLAIFVAFNTIGLSAAVVTTNGNSVTTGPRTTIIANFAPSGGINVAACAMDSQKVLVLSGFGAPTSNLGVMLTLLVVSGTNITIANSEVVFDDEATGRPITNTTITPLSSSLAVFAYQRYSTIGQLYIQAVNISEGVISIGSSVVILQSDTRVVPALSALSSTRAVLTFRNPLTSAGNGAVIDVSGLVVTIGPSSVYASGITNTTQVIAALTQTSVLLGYGSYVVAGQVNGFSLTWGTPVATSMTTITGITRTASDMAMAIGIDATQRTVLQRVIVAGVAVTFCNEIVPGITNITYSSASEASLRDDFNSANNTLWCVVSNGSWTKSYSSGKMRLVAGNNTIGRLQGNFSLLGNFTIEVAGTRVITGTDFGGTNIRAWFSLFSYGAATQFTSDPYPYGKSHKLWYGVSYNRKTLFAEFTHYSADLNEIIGIGPTESNKSASFRLKFEKVGSTITVTKHNGTTWVAYRTYTVERPDMPLMVGFMEMDATSYASGYTDWDYIDIAIQPENASPVIAVTSSNVAAQTRESSSGNAKAIVGVPLSSSLVASGSYGDIIGKQSVSIIAWVKRPTVGVSSILIERGYRVTLARTYISLGNATATWEGSNITQLMNVLNDGNAHMLSLYFQNSGGNNWQLSASIDGAPYTNQGTQTSGSQPVATANTSPTIKGNSLDQTQWINEVAMWSEVPIFTPVELQNLYDLGNVFGDTLDQYEENYGPPLCWQATAMMPDGSVWRDAGTGLCPQIIRVPNGAVDIIVTDGGRQVTPIIRES